jgi:flagellar motility protein MotE (MotC chaperone)
MRSVVLISLVTFVLIFGSMLLITNHLREMANQEENLPELSPDDFVAAERLLQDMALERDRLQQEKEKMLALEQRLAVEEKIVEQARLKLEEVIKRLDAEQKIYNAEKEKSARKLAKMYEAMKPAKAAPILSSLDMEIILEIITRMKEKPAAKIMSYMDAGLAARISTRMSMKGAG